MNEQRLLILDDDEMIGQTISYIARSMGLEARTTSKASDFFVLLEEWQPGRIALDLVMPDMDGVQVLAELAKRDCRAEIIITSGVGPRVLDAARRSAREHGLNILGVLSKPFSPANLRQLLTAETATGQQRASPGPDSAEVSIEYSELNEAIEQRELSLAYQPKVHCRNGLLHGFEALVRWNSPTHGHVPPGRFIPLAEREGLMGDLTGLVIELALNWYAGELTAAFKSKPGRASDPEAMPTLSINLSARTLGDSSFVERVAADCAALQIPPSQIIFELTETSAMEDPVASLDLLTRLRMKGFQLSIDDFGTGYSSMLQLVRLPFSEIKVDRSFVMTANSSSESRAVIRSIVELGHSLGLRTTAEGVEDAKALEYLTSIGCDLAQGFFISRPLSPQDAVTWVQQD